MRIRLVPADSDGCGAYRMRWPAGVLSAAGYDVVVAEPGRALLATVDGSHVVKAAHPEADVVVLQRPMGRLVAETIPFLQAQGVGVAVEVDDDFSALLPTNVAFGHNHPRNDPDVNWNHLRTCCRLADLVVCTTPALAQRYGRPGRVRVVPNFIPERYCKAGGQAHDRVRLGWSGTMSSHAGDLEVTRGAVGRVLAATEAMLHIIGPEDDGDLVGRALGLGRPATMTGWVPLDEYADTLAELDVGMVPLADTKFNQAKSELKGLEMAATGVAFVASDTPAYRQLAADGAGRLARKPAEWARELRRLICDAAWRVQVAAAGRALAEQRTIEQHAWRFFEAWAAAAR